MSAQTFLIVWLLCLATMLVCRCAPILLLQGRELSERAKEGLSLIPSAAFAALVANDLFNPGMFEGGLAAGITPLVSAAVVVFVARKTSSLIWCVITGVLVYAFLVFIF